MFGHKREGFYFRPSRRHWFWHRPIHAFADDPPAEGDEQVWRVAWWHGGWGVWSADADPMAAEPVYTTKNIPQADSDAACCWAAGVVPAHPRLHISCSHRGDPAAPFM
jgi:hypothetical protein